MDKPTFTTVSTWKGLFLLNLNYCVLRTSYRVDEITSNNRLQILYSRILLKRTCAYAVSALKANENTKIKI